MRHSGSARRRALMGTVGLCALALSAGEGAAQAIIDNGRIALGVNPEGNLNVPGTGFGLSFLPSPPGQRDATFPGCLCEGWGLADFEAAGSPFAKAGEVFGVQNVTVESFTTDGSGTLDGLSVPNARSATSVVRTDLGGGYDLLVTHAFSPATETRDLYRVDVTIENVGSTTVNKVVYRRAMDWDVPPTEFSEFVTIGGTDRARKYKGSSNDGFVDGNPHVPLQLISGEGAVLNGNFTDAGPADHGAAFDFDFGALPPGEDVVFVIFYGASLTEEDAVTAAAAVGAEVFSFGQPSTEGGPTEGTPNTFIFAFREVGGVPIVDPRAAPEIPAAVLSFLSNFVNRHHTKTTRLFISIGSGARFVRERLAQANLNTQLVDDAYGVEGLRAYVTANYLDGEVRAFGTTPAFDYNGYGTVFGMDYTFDSSVIGGKRGQQMTVGASFGYQTTDGSTDATNTSIDVNGYTGQLYAGVRMPKGPYLLSSFTATHLDIDQRRVAGGAVFEGDPNGLVLSSMLEGGIEFPEQRGILGTEAAALQVTPFGSVEYQYSRTSEFTESGGGVTVGQIDDTSLIGRMGVRGTTSYTMPSAELFAQVELNGAFDFFSDDNEVVVVNAAGGQQTQQVDAFDDAALELRVSGGATFNQAVTGFVQYFGGFSEHSTEHSVTGGVAVRF